MRATALAAAGPAPCQLDAGQSQDNHTHIHINKLLIPTAKLDRPEGAGQGQLGNGTKELESTPAPVIGITNATEVSGRYGTRCALLASESVSCWGENGYGELGDGTTEDKATPVAVKGLTDVKAVSAGGSLVCALLTTGGVDCWGANQFGELGDGTTGGPEICSEGVPCSRKPVAVSGISNATAIGLEGGHACAVLTTGHIVCWGLNDTGGLGDGSEAETSDTPVEVSGITNATSVDAAFWVTCAVLASGHVDCWGEEDGGGLGNGDEEHGTHIQRTPVEVSGITNATEVTAGGVGGCARLSTGHLGCWGENEWGELGDGTTTGSSVPVEVSGISSALAVSKTEAGDTCALLAGGEVDCWGVNDSGQLGYPPNEAEEHRDSPVEVPGFP